MPKFSSVCIIVGLVAFVLAACGTDSPRDVASDVDSSLEPVVIVVTATEDATLEQSVFRAQPTFPATWTPTATHTPTNTPTPTLTPTATATPDAVAICAAFNVNLRVQDGAIYDTSDSVRLFVDTGGVEVGTKLTLFNTDTEEEADFVLPGGPAYPVNIVLNSAPGTGELMWTLVALTTRYGEICEVGGRFTVVPRSPVDVLLNTFDDLISAANNASQTVPQSSATSTP